MIVVKEVNTSRKRRYDRTQYPRVYFWHDKETISENYFVGRRTRPQAEYRKLMPAILKLVGFSEGTKFRWDSHAGCTMCACSPGFVLSEKRGYDYHVTVQRGEYDEAVRAAVKEV